MLAGSPPGISAGKVSYVHVWLLVSTIYIFSTEITDVVISRL